MNIKELIEKLQTYPSDLRVVLDGYEIGYNDISIFEEMEIYLDVHDEWYYGQHSDEPYEGSKCIGINGLRIAGKNMIARNSED